MEAYTGISGRLFFYDSKEADYTEVVQIMEKKQTGTGRPKLGTTEKRKRPDSESRIINTGSDQNHAEKGKDRKIVAILIILLVVVIFALMLQFKGRNNGDFSKVHLDMPEFEDSVVYDGSGEEKAAKDGVNLAVIPDFTVTKDNQSFVIPYPENEYDAEFYFVDKESGEERYRTKRIKPGTVVKIPAYSFCDDGEHAYRVEVGVFDGESFEEVPSAVALEMNITKE